MRIQLFHIFRLTICNSGVLFFLIINLQLFGFKHTLQAFFNIYHIYAISVYDDSGQNAHFLDSRTSTSGIGHGIVLIATDKSDDAPLGYAFAPSSSINVHRINTAARLAISAGRYL